eukprot:PhF_6_TR797/c0_g1_i1/m.1218
MTESVDHDLDLYYLKNSPLWVRLKKMLHGPAEVKAMRMALGESIITKFEAICDEIESLKSILVDYRAETAQEIQMHRKRRDVSLSLAPAGIDLLNAHLQMILTENSTTTSRDEEALASSRRPRTARPATSATRHFDPLAGVPQNQLRFDKLFHESSWIVNQLRQGIEIEYDLLVKDAEWIQELILDERSYRNHVTQKLTDEVTSSTNVATLRALSKKVQHTSRIQQLPHASLRRQHIAPIPPKDTVLCPPPSHPPKHPPFQRAVTDSLILE